MRLEFLNLYIKKIFIFLYGCLAFLPISCVPDVRFASKTHHCNPLDLLHSYAKQNNTWKSPCRSQLLFSVCPTPHILYPDFFGRKARVPFLCPKTSCIAKKGPSPRYARKSKFTLVRVRLPPFIPAYISLPLTRLSWQLYVELCSLRPPPFFTGWLKPNQVFFSLSIRFALKFFFFFFLFFWLFLLFFGSIPRESIIYIFAIVGIYFSLPTLRSGRVNYVGVGCFLQPCIILL